MRAESDILPGEDPAELRPPDRDLGRRARGRDRGGTLPRRGRRQGLVADRPLPRRRGRRASPARCSTPATPTTTPWPRRSSSSPTGWRRSPPAVVAPAPAVVGRLPLADRPLGVAGRAAGRVEGPRADRAAPGRQPDGQAPRRPVRPGGVAAAGRLPRGAAARRRAGVRAPLGRPARGDVPGRSSTGGSGRSAPRCPTRRGATRRRRRSSPRRSTSWPSGWSWSRRARRATASWR